MITKYDIKKLLNVLGFTTEDSKVYTKTYEQADTTLTVDVQNEHFGYEEAKITVGRETTSNFAEPENFVVFECIDRLLTKGYRPEHIELEPRWKLGHSSKSGYADIWVRTYKGDAFIGTDEDKDSLLIIECKKSDEFNSAWNDTLEDGAQLFSYFQQEKSTKFLCLYTADLTDEGKVTCDYYLLHVRDNDKMLENEEEALNYKAASNNKQLYKVWHETYHCDFAKIGLFEDSVQPYHIGKDKYTVTDLAPVNNETIKKKYSEFSNILRQHNVGAHENAFDKLVNLFLAKIVDERNNPDDLHFYWKGSAYDDDFQLQDRLQRLYRDGMKKFLGEEVTYIEEKEIDKAFRRFKNDPDATRKTIKDYFRALKFFSDNDFSFISVHNKKLFQQNAAILRKVVLMLQNIKLKDSDTHQFLGDLFEGFLTKGVKQSEGQFFTPMPIVRFIVTSLPLESIIKDSQDIPWAIDYACGAGHFLTEYADRIKEYVEKYRPDIPLQDYYARITGIEKEYRLSKVSKVSAFMYGHDETQIVYSDALQSHPDIELDKYNVLIANPPYAVSGFLETLPEKERKTYKLFNDDINLAKNNAIETFFIERAAQLMKADGVAAIILPVSVLNKGGIYAKAREIILENFHIVSLVELGSGTFGKTGTNTVIMFLRRKETNTPDYEHYLNRVHSWFNLSEDADEVYQDTDLMEKYCQHLGYAVEDYQEFLKGNMADTFLDSEVIQSYKTSFFGNSRNAMKDVCEEAKSIRTKYVAKTKTASFRALSDEDKQKEADKSFYAFVKAIEKEKMYFFILAIQTENPVLLVKSPLPKKGESNEKIKKFLGYEWINRKGNEGISYLNIDTTSVEDNDDGNEADDDTMIQINGINSISTPLFNPINFNDAQKINSLVRCNFNNEELIVPDELIDNVSVSSLVNIIDFKHTAFNKAFRTKAIREFKYVTKWPIAKLGSLTIGEPEYGANESAKDGDPDQDYRYIRITDINDFGRLNSEWKTAEFVDTKYILREGDILFARSGATAGKVFYYKAEYGKALYAGYLIRFRFDEQKVLPKYVANVLCADVYTNWVEFNRGGSAQPNLNAKQFASFEIPVPSDMEIQTRIIEECDKEDEIYKLCADKLDNLEKELERIENSAQQKATETLRLDNESLFDLTIGRRVLRSELKKDGAYDVYSANVFEPFGKIDTSLLSDFSTPSVLWGIDGDWMVNYLAADKPFHPTDHCGVIKVKDESVVLAKYLVYPLLKEGERERFSRANRASTERIKALTIKVPSIDMQREAVLKIFEIEQQIADLKSKMAECQNKKQSILDKYLK